MPERWQQELKKLRDVEPGVGSWERAQRPPRGDGMPPRRQRVIAGVVAFAVFAAAGAFAWQALRPSTSAGHIPGADANTIVAVFDVGDINSGTSGRLIVGNRTVEGTVGSHCWTFDGGSGCADAIPPAFSASDFVPVVRGSTLVIGGNASSVTGEIDRAGRFPFERAQDLGTLSGPVPLDRSPGRYVLSLEAHADDGDVPFYFPIELVEPAPAGIAVLALEAMSAGPAASLTFGSTRLDAILGENKWCDGAGHCQGVVPDWGPPVPYPPPVEDFLPVEAGTPISIEGDAVALKAGFQTESNDQVSLVDLQDPGNVPSKPGRYVLQVHVAMRGADGSHGSATFFLGVEARAPVGDATATPSPGDSVLLVSCTDGGAVVSTPTVMGTMDGLHVHALDQTGRAADVIVSQPDQPPLTWSASAEGSAFDPLVVMAAPPGTLSLSCVDRDSAPIGTSANFTLLAPSGAFLPWTLDCPRDAITSSGSIPLVLRDVGDPRDLAMQFVDERPGDEANQAGWVADAGVFPMMISFERDGHRVGWIRLGAAGHHLIATAFAACTDSGLAPSVSVPSTLLGCPPADQLAFTHTGPALLPAGEAFIRGNLTGILLGDVVERPQVGFLSPDEGIWTVSRDGVAIAWVDYGSLTGVACRGFGIQNT